MFNIIECDECGQYFCESEYVECRTIPSLFCSEACMDANPEVIRYRAKLESDKNAFNDLNTPPQGVR